MEPKKILEATERLLLKPLSLHNAADKVPNKLTGADSIKALEDLLFLDIIERIVAEEILEKYKNEF